MRRVCEALPSPLKPRPSNLRKASTPSVALKPSRPGLTRAMRPGGGRMRGEKYHELVCPMGSTGSPICRLRCGLLRTGAPRDDAASRSKPTAAISLPRLEGGLSASPCLLDYVPCAMHNVRLRYCGATALLFILDGRRKEADLTCQANTIARDGQLITTLEGSSDNSLTRRPHNTGDWTRQRRPRLPCPRRVINCGQGHERQSWTHAGVGK